MSKKDPKNLVDKDLVSGNLLNRWYVLQVDRILVTRCTFRDLLFRSHVTLYFPPSLRSVYSLLWYSPSPTRSGSTEMTTRPLVFVRWSV